MKISREWLVETLGDKDVDVVNEISGHSRWSRHYHRVVRFEGKFYRANYSEGATEYQDEGAYEHAPAEIECVEVYPVQKTITVYETLP